ncbi:transposase family protein [Kribbella sp. NPDC026611]|uniref:transposase family protein n=1 Tax=Kribbella sp. NPDC026611 TaxID=3154911 RepID=UPI0033D55774
MLLYLRQNLSQTVLADLYGISQPTVSRIYRHCPVQTQQVPRPHRLRTDGQQTLGWRLLNNPQRDLEWWLAEQSNQQLTTEASRHSKSLFFLGLSLNLFLEDLTRDF